MPKTGTPVAPIKNKSVAGTNFNKEIYAGKIISITGHGKSTFYLGEVERSARNLAQSLGKDNLDFNNPEDVKWLNDNKIPDMIYMAIIDNDVRGIDCLAASVVPAPLIGCLEKWSVTDSPDGKPAWQDAEDALHFYQQKLQDHYQKYPNGRRFLVLESEDYLYQHVVNYFVLETSQDGDTCLADAVLSAREATKRLGKHQSALGNPRDSFWAIYSLYDRYMLTAITFCNAVGTSFISTAHIVVKTIYDKEGKPIEERKVESGKPERAENFYDFVLQLERVKDGRIFCSTDTDLAKNRLCKGSITIDITNKNGPIEFWNKVNELKKVISK